MYIILSQREWSRESRAGEAHESMKVSKCKYLTHEPYGTEIQNKIWYSEEDVCLFVSQQQQLGTYGEAECPCSSDILSNKAAKMSWGREERFEKKREKEDYKIVVDDGCCVVRGCECECEGGRDSHGWRGWPALIAKPLIKKSYWVRHHHIIR